MAKKNYILIRCSTNILMKKRILNFYELFNQFSKFYIQIDPISLCKFRMAKKNVNCAVVFIASPNRRRSLDSRSPGDQGVRGTIGYLPPLSPTLWRKQKQPFLILKSFSIKYPLDFHRLTK